MPSDNLLYLGLESVDSFDCRGGFFVAMKFVPGTTLEQVWEHYLFDRQLRLLFMDAIERIEISLRVKFDGFDSDVAII